MLKRNGCILKNKKNPPEILIYIYEITQSSHLTSYKNYKETMKENWKCPHISPHINRDYFL
jgi:hypothetical protein